MQDPMTEAQFAQQCAYMAKKCAAWSGDMLILPENFHRTANVEMVRRFTSEVREHCDVLEKWANGQPISEDQERTPGPTRG